MIERFVLKALEALAYLLLGSVIGIAFMMHERAVSQPAASILVDLPKVQKMIPKVTPRLRRTHPALRACGTSQMHCPSGSVIGQAGATPVKIAIIDTGYDEKNLPEGYPVLKICPEGSYDFVVRRKGVTSSHWHGNVTASIIANLLQDVNYCALVYNVATGASIPDDALLDAVKQASKEHLFAVNLSLGGTVYSAAIHQALLALEGTGTTIFIAAGNDNKNLNSVCNTYPACFKLKNTFVVGATDHDVFKASYSNEGTKVNSWYDGSFNYNGQLVQGTSFASPRALGDWVQSAVSAEQ